MPKLADLHESHARLVTEMRSITDTAEAENRDFTDAEDSKFKQLKADLAALDRRIERATALAEAERSAPAVIHGENRGDGTFEQRAREFSVTKAIRAALGDSSVDAGRERELSQELRTRTGREFQGIAVPDEVFQTEKRTLLAGSTAADLIPNVHRGDLFIDRLRSALVTERLGATVLSGLVGTVDIPRQTGSSAAQWVDEDGSLTETDAAFDDVTLAPKTVGAMTSYSRRTLLSASPAIEQIVRNDLARIVAGAIDNKAMLGDGSANTPTGVVNQTGAQNISLMSGATWEKILSFPAAIQNVDADGSMGWALNAWAVKKLRATPKDGSNGGEGYLMDGPNTLAGYTAAVTSALPGDPDLDSSPPVPTVGTVIFGNWSSLLIGYWSGVDIVLNPYETTAYAKGRVLVRAMRDVDVQVRHGEAFAYAQDMPVH